MKYAETVSFASLASCSAGHWEDFAFISLLFYFDYEYLQLSFPYLPYLEIVGFGEKKAT